jgi:hypothetical protein
VRALQRYGTQEQRQRFLPPLLDADYDRSERGAQYLTEAGRDRGASCLPWRHVGSGSRPHHVGHLELADQPL